MSGRSVISPIASDGGGGGALIEAVKSLSAQSSYVVNITPNAFRRADFYISGLGGMTSGFPTGVLVTCNGDTTAGHYSWLGQWYQNSTGFPASGPGSSGSSGVNTALVAAITGAAPASEIDMKISLWLPSGKNRAILSDYDSKGAAAATDIWGTFRGYWLDTSSTITTVTFTFGSAFTGTIESRGIAL